MTRYWWPGPLYEARPYGALALGVTAVFAALARALAQGEWQLAAGVAFIAGCAVTIYGGVVLQMRIEYRRRSRWRREQQRQEGHSP